MNNKWFRVIQESWATYGKAAKEKHQRPSGEAMLEGGVLNCTVVAALKEMGLPPPSIHSVFIQEGCIVGHKTTESLGGEGLNSQLIHDPMDSNGIFSKPLGLRPGFLVGHCAAKRGDAVVAHIHGDQGRI